MARRFQDKPNEGRMDFESLVYGNQNLEDDEELMAELLALAGEVSANFGFCPFIYIPEF
jgi:hypothetical protein